MRVALRHLRGVEIGERTWVGFDTLIEPAYPQRVVIGKRVAIGIRVLILAHFAHHGRNRETSDGSLDRRVSVRIEDDVFIAPGVVIMPNVSPRRGSRLEAVGSRSAAGHFRFTMKIIPPRWESARARSQGFLCT
jgi:acetyltransferase-like isoleucine patch superfamily enzyme